MWQTITKTPPDFFLYNLNSHFIYLGITEELMQNL